MSDHTGGSAPPATAVSSADERPEVSFSDVFSTRKPKDFKAGVSSGLKSMGKGFFAGAVGLVAAPIAGARSEGVKGCAKGVAAGLVGAVALPVAGVTVGTAQGVRSAALLRNAVRRPCTAVARHAWITQLLHANPTASNAEHPKR